MLNNDLNNTTERGADNMKFVLVLCESYSVALKNVKLKPTTDVGFFMDNPTLFDLVMFTGGEDVSPELYGDTSPKMLCGYNLDRDKREARIYQVALKYGIKMTGICRGIQFLNVMNGGKMMHHITNHAGTIHSMTTVWGETVLVNSTHHQMCIPGPGGVVVGWSEPISSVYIGEGDEKVDYHGKEVEAIVYPGTNCAGVQYHPEMLLCESEGFKWYENFIKRFLYLPMSEFLPQNLIRERRNAASQ